MRLCALTCQVAHPSKRQTEQTREPLQINLGELRVQVQPQELSSTSATFCRRNNTAGFVLHPPIQQDGSPNNTTSRPCSHLRPTLTARNLPLPLLDPSTTHNTRRRSPSLPKHLP